MKSLPTSYRLAVTSRIFAALLGGYVLAALASVCMGLWLPMPRAEAVISAMMTSFLVYLVAVLWCFACRSAWQAWFGLAVPGVVLATFSVLGHWLGRS